MATKHQIVMPPIVQEVLHYQFREALIRWHQAKSNSEAERDAEDDIRTMICNLMRKHAREAVILDRERQAKLAAPRVPLEFMTQKIEHQDDNTWRTTLVHIGAEHGQVPLHPTLYKGV